MKIDLSPEEEAILKKIDRPDRRKGSGESYPSKGVREAIAFLASIEEALGKISPDILEDLAAIAHACESPENLKHGAFLIRNALNALSNSPTREGINRKQELAFYSHQELLQICRSDKKKYRGFGGMKYDDLIEHIAKCEQALNLEEPFIA